MTSRVARLLAVLALAVLIGACGARSSESVRPTLAPLPTPAPGATPLPTLTACGQAPSASPGASPAAGEVVTPIADFPAGDAYEITAVTYSPNGFVAVGFGPMPGEDFDGRRQGIVWISCDGLAWQRIVDPSLQYVSPNAVVALGADLYVFGNLATCDEFDDECEDVAEAGNVVFRSAVGGPWQRLTPDPALQYAYFEGVAAINGRLAAYGTADDDLLTATLWRSDDGVTWTAATELAGMDPISALTAYGDGVLAFGSEFVDELEDTQLVAATSADGQRFTAVTVPQLLGGTVVSVTAGPAGYSAVGVGYPEGTDLALKAVALYSADGQSWIETDADDGSFEGSSLDRVHPLPAGYAATGFAIDENDFTSQAGFIWLSPDGRGWRQAAEFGTSTTEFVASAIGPTGLVLFTADVEESDDGDVISTIGAYFAPIDRLAP